MHEDPIAIVCPPCTGRCHQGRLCPDNRAPTLPMSGPVVITTQTRARFMPRLSVSTRAVLWGMVLGAVGSCAVVLVLVKGLP